MNHYRMLAVNLIVSAAIMYLVMFAMINRLDDFYNNINMVFMTAMMVASMGVLMLLTMGSMYENRKINVALYAAFAALFVGGIVFIRSQAFIGDTEFLRSMIPHHSGAILMCTQASISDPEVKELCGEIARSQSAEIKQMNRILSRL